VTEVIRRYNGAGGEAPAGGVATAGGDELLVLARDCKLRTTHFGIKMMSSL